MELLRDRSQELDEVGVRAAGVSRDSPWSHIAWMQALDLTFPLLSDWNGDATHAFGVAYEHRGLRDVSARSAFLMFQPRFLRPCATTEERASGRNAGGVLPSRATSNRKYRPSSCSDG